MKPTLILFLMSLPGVLGAVVVSLVDRGHLLKSKRDAVKAFVDQNFLAYFGVVSVSVLVFLASAAVLLTQFGTSGNVRSRIAWSATFGVVVQCVLFAVSAALGWTGPVFWTISTTGSIKRVVLTWFVLTVCLTVANEYLSSSDTLVWTRPLVLGGVLGTLGLLASLAWTGWKIDLTV